MTGGVLSGSQECPSTHREFGTDWPSNIFLRDSRANVVPLPQFSVVALTEREERPCLHPVRAARISRSAPMDPSFRPLAFGRTKARQSRTLFRGTAFRDGHNCLFDCESLRFGTIARKVDMGIPVVEPDSESLRHAVQSRLHCPPLCIGTPFGKGAVSGEVLRRWAAT